MATNQITKLRATSGSGITAARTAPGCNNTTVHHSRLWQQTKQNYRALLQNLDRLIDLARYLSYYYFMTLFCVAPIGGR